MTLREDLEAKVGKMTLGPWSVDVRAIEQLSMGPLGTGPLAYYTGCVTVVEAGYNGEDVPHGVVREHDAAGIVALRNSAPALLAALRVVELLREMDAVGSIATIYLTPVRERLAEYDRLAAEVAG